VNDHDRVRWARALTTAGWLFVVAYLTILSSQIRRAFALRQASFEDGLWGQRIEQISFVALPQNLVVLVPGAAAGVAAVLLLRDSGDRSELWLSQLVRVTAGVAYVVIALAALGVVAVFWRDPDGVSDVSAVLGRIGGIVMSIAMIRVCTEADRPPASPPI
jgi:hypothetical protein